MKDDLGRNVILTLASGLEVSDLADCVEESRVLTCFQASTEANIERVRLPLLIEDLSSIA